jgi:prepilin-type N-terminal cleavage/methylation domain-containing protein
MSRADQSRGFTLIELLVSMIVVATMMAGVIQFYLVQSRTNTQQDQSVALEENLRLASGMVSDALRNARYATPGGSNPSSWVTWVPNFTSNPLVTQGSGSNPDTLSVAACFQEPVATLSACVGTAGCPVAIGVTSLSVIATGGRNLADLLDTSNKGLVRIGETEFAFVTSVNSTSIGVDTGTAAGTQGIQKPHPIGAEICRVDVITFSIGNDPTTGLPCLLRNENQGGNAQCNAQAAAEGINDLQISLTPPKTYQVSLRGRSEGNDPMIGAPLQRSLATTITLRN